MTLSITGRLTGETRTPDEIREAVYLFTGDIGAKQSRFWLLLALATTIATTGIISDSTATVIGAMIIAPLAIPIQGVAVAITAGETRALLLSALTVLGAACAVVALGGLLGVILPQLHPPADNSQITARVAPTLVDLVAAAATGLAGAFAVARRDIGDILPGVAIAISLVPPLSVVGVTAVDGDWAGALGALTLFATNVLAMIVVGVAVFGAMGVLRERAAEPAMRRRPVYGVIAVASVIVVAALGVATFRTVQLTRWRDGAARVATAWAQGRGERVVSTEFEGDELVFLIEGPAAASGDGRLLTLLRGTVPGGTPVIVNRVPGERRAVGEVAS